jgi:hypothetical protein
MSGAVKMMVEIEAPKLLVEWSSPWQEFLTAVGPAMGKSAKPLAGEARTGMFPYRGLLMTWAMEALVLLAAIILPGKLASMQPYQPPAKPKYDVIYFSGEELPQTQDAGGAHSGTSGRTGGHHAYHRTQTIKVARGDAAVEKVVDAPKINLPKSDVPVANLLAINRVPGPPPASGLRSSLPALPQATPVPPPPTVSESKLHQAPNLTTTVVAPSPTVQREIAGVRLPEAKTDIVPPPVSAPVNAAALPSRLSMPQPSVVAPPPSSVTREVASMSGAQMNDVQKQIVPPPVQVGGEVSGRPSAGALSASNQVVPPPPTVNGGTSLTGRGRGDAGLGLGGALDVGSVAAPPSGAGGNSTRAGVVISSQPGSKVGVPGSGGAGSLAMSPAGGSKSGIGGSGAGGGIGLGNGPGSGLTGEGSGAGRTGTGRGSDPSARGGISPYAGPGGAGSGAKGTSTTAGISVHGGNTITLPSFGPSGGSPDVPGRSSTSPDRRGPGITVEATPRSGGAFNFYGALKGDKVYSIFIPTAEGMAVLEYSDPTSTRRAYSSELQPPEAMRTDLPANLPHSRLVIACILDRSGLLRDVHLLEPAGPEMNAKVLASLTKWKFRPAQRGDQPVEVNAILGFNVDTR